MNEFLRTFVMKTIRGMVGNVPEYQVRLYAAGWMEKGVLTESNLAEIELLLTPVEETGGTEPIPEEKTEG